MKTVQISLPHVTENQVPLQMNVHINMISPIMDYLLDFCEHV